MATHSLVIPQLNAARIDDLRLAWESNPQDAEARFDYAIALLGKGDRRAALEELNGTLELAPNFAVAANWRDQVLTQLALERRIEALRVAASGAGPVEPLEWTECAEALGDPEGQTLLEEYFQKYAERVVPGHPHETAPMRTLAWSWIQTLDPDKVRQACELMRVASRSKHRCAEDLAIYALARENAGQMDEIAQIIQEGLSLINDSSDAATGLRLLFEGILKRTSG